MAQAKLKHRATIAQEIQSLSKLEPPALHTHLRACIAGKQAVSNEALVYLLRITIHKDVPGYSLAFEALAKQVTPLLLRQFSALLQHERHEYAQEVLLELHAMADAGKASLGYGEINFNDFLKCRSIDKLRQRNKQIEVKRARIEPTEDSDPIDTLKDKSLSPEDKAHIQKSLEKLPSNLRTVFIQFHMFDLTQEEIGKAHGVDARTVRNWLTQAASILQASGENYVE